MKGRRALTFEVIDALSASSLGACALRVALALGRFQGGNDWAWCSVEAIRERVGGADRRTVQRALSELRDAGFVLVEEERGKGSRYQLAVPEQYAARGAHDTGGADAAGDEDDGAAAAPLVGGGAHAAPPAAPTPPAGGESVRSHLSQETDQGSVSTNAHVWTLASFDRTRAGDLGRLGEYIQRKVGDAQVEQGSARTPLDTSSRWLRLAEFVLETSTEPSRPMPLAEVIEQLAEGWARDGWARANGHPIGALLGSPQKYFAARQVGPTAPSRFERPQLVAARTSRADRERDWNPTTKPEAANG